MTLRGTTPVPNFFLDKRMVDLSASSVRVYLKIVRNTLGWRDQDGNVKGRDWIAHSQFAKVGVSSRSVTNAVDELLQHGLIRVTDDQGNSLSNPKRRKHAKRIFYGPVLETQAETTYNKVKIAPNSANTIEKTTQVLPTTKENFTKEYRAETAQGTERLTDSQRIKRIMEEQQNKQIQRDSWNF